MRLDDPTGSVIMEIDPDRFYSDSTSCKVCDINLAADRLLILTYPRPLGPPEQAARIHVVDNGTGALLYQFRAVAYEGNNVRIDHLEQPVFAWK